MYCEILLIALKVIKLQRMQMDVKYQPVWVIFHNDVKSNLIPRTCV